MKKLFKIFALLLAVLVFSSCEQPVKKEVEKAVEEKSKFSFAILKIGQADAIIMQTENHSVMIDCGEDDDAQEILEKLAEKGIGELDYLLITHFDKDHVGGAQEILSNVKTKNIITPDYEGGGKKYKEYAQKVEELGLTPNRLAEKTEFVLDGVEFEVYPPEKEVYTESDNDYSLAITVKHGENTFLFAGDAEKERLSEIMHQTGKEYEFLKVPHHGKYNEMTEAFIKSVTPSYAVITCSDKNPAEQKTVDVLNAINTETYFTKDGDVTVKSDGKDILITQ